MKNTVSTFKEQKVKGDKITMLTAYDYSTAKLMDQSGINGILVGDSLGMVMLGYENTLPVTVTLPEGYELVEDITVKVALIEASEK